MRLKEIHFISGNQTSFPTVQSLQTDGANNSVDFSHPQQALKQPHKLAEESEWTRCKNNTFYLFQHGLKLEPIKPKQIKLSCNSSNLQFVFQMSISLISYFHFSYRI